MALILNAYHQERTFDARCLCCRKWYKSEGVRKDFGQCTDCYLKENQELLNLKCPNLKKTAPKRVYPRWLGEEKIQSIFDFYKKNQNRKRENIIAEINDRFDVELTLRHLDSIVQRFYQLSKKKKCNQ